MRRKRKVRLPTFGDGERRAPLVSQDVEANAAVGVDVRVVDAGGEVDLRRLKGVVGREVNGEEEDTARVRRVTLDCKSQQLSKKRSLSKIRRMEDEHTGPIIVACQWN